MNSLYAQFQSADRVQALLGEISTISALPDPGAACEHLRSIAGSLGFASSAFATFLQNDPWHQSYRLLLACDDDQWCAAYQRQACFSDDPWLSYARKHSSPARILEIDCHTAKQLEIVAMARHYGVHDGLIVPAPSSGGLSRLGVLMLGCSDPLYLDSPAFTKLKVVARALATELLDWYVAFMRAELKARANLSDMDIDLLRYDRQGMTTKEIERRFGFPAAAINSRFQRIIAKLKVGGRRAASQLAAEHGLI